MGQVLSSFLGFPAAVRRFYRWLMGIPNVLDLPPELVETILLKVANNSYTDLVRCKKVCTALRDAAEADTFYRSVDLFTLETPWRNIISIVDFNLLCLQFQNPSALFIIGARDFFRTDNMEQGFQQIRLAAVRGYDVAIYTYAFLTRIMYPGVVFEERLVNPPRDFIRAARRKIKGSGRGYWGNGLNPLYLQRAAQLDVFFARIRACPCQVINNWGHLWEEWCKPEPICEACFWMIESLAFREEVPDRMAWILLEYPPNAE